MKHPKILTVAVMAWLVLAVTAGLWFVPRLLATSPNLQEIGLSPIAFAALLFTIILIAAIFWSLLMRYTKPRAVDIVFSFALSLVAVDVVKLFTDLNVFSRFAIALLLTAGFFLLVRAMQRSWKVTILASPITNAYILLVTVFAAASIAATITPFIAFALLILASVYDAWAVWKSNFMANLAEYFIDRRALPGIAIPYPDKEQFALLGGGDVFFIVIVAGSLMRTHPTTAIMVAIGAVLSIAALFWWSKEDTYYPALPFILIGALVGATGGALI